MNDLQLLMSSIYEGYTKKIPLISEGKDKDGAIYFNPYVAKYSLPDIFPSNPIEYERALQNKDVNIENMLVQIAAYGGKEQLKEQSIEDARGFALDRIRQASHDLNIHDMGEKARSIQKTVKLSLEQNAYDDPLTPGFIVAFDMANDGALSRKYQKKVHSKEANAVFDFSKRLRNYIAAETNTDSKTIQNQALAAVKVMTRGVTGLKRDEKNTISRILQKNSPLHAKQDMIDNAMAQLHGKISLEDEPVVF